MKKTSNGQCVQQNNKDTVASCIVFTLFDKLPPINLTNINSIYALIFAMRDNSL